MEYLLSCSCGKEHRITKTQAGQTIECDCGETVQIPTLRGFGELKVAENEITATRKAAATTTAWTGWRGPAMALTSLLLLLSVIFTGYSFFQSYRNNLNYTPEDHVAQSKELVDNWGPVELSEVWDTFQIGLTTRQTPVYELYNIYSQEQKQLGMTGLVVSSVLALIAAGIWISAPKKTAE